MPSLTSGRRHSAWSTSSSRPSSPLSPPGAPSLRPRGRWCSSIGWRGTWVMVLHFFKQQYGTPFHQQSSGWCETWRSVPIYVDPSPPPQSPAIYQFISVSRLFLLWLSVPIFYLFSFYYMLTHFSPNVMSMSFRLLGRREEGFPM